MVLDRTLVLRHRVERASDAAPSNDQPAGVVSRRPEAPHFAATRTPRRWPGRRISLWSSAPCAHRLRDSQRESEAQICTSLQLVSRLSSFDSVGLCHISRWVASAGGHPAARPPPRVRLQMAACRWEALLQHSSRTATEPTPLRVAPASGKLVEFHPFCV